MKRVNNFEFTGNCTADAKIITCNNGKQKATFSVAVNYYSKNKEGKDESVVEYYNVETWKTTAFDLIKKGASVIVKGFRKGCLFNEKPYFIIVSNDIEAFVPDPKE